MKFKSLLLISSACLLFACGGSGVNSANSSGETPNAFDVFKNAVTFATNDEFTGYRLYVTIKNKSSKEQVYNLSRIVQIDNASNTCELTETITKINDSIEGEGESIDEKTHMYYTLGSIIVEGEDGRYTEIDGTITKSTGLPKINPSEDCFDNLQLDLYGNVLEAEGDIIPSKANELFNTTGLENISNATMEASIYDDILEEVTWNYDIDDLNVDQRLVILYDSYTITPPAL